MSSAKRYFRNQAACREEKKKDQEPSDTEKRQEQLLTRPTVCTTLAERFLSICCEAYEQEPHQSNESLGTLYHGALGPRVLLRLRMAQHLQRLALKNQDTNGQVQTLLQEALALAEQAVQVETKRLQRHRVRVTLLEGPFVGAKALVAAIHCQLGNGPKAQQEATELVQFLDRHTQNMPANECEVLYGRAGALQAISFLRNELQNNTLGSPVALRLAQDIVQEGQRAAKAASNQHHHLPLLWEWHHKQYLGAAHGVVGILHILLGLQLSELHQIQTTTKGTDLPLLIQQAIQALDPLCWPETGNLRSSIPTSSSSTSEDKLVHWCHGAPGHVLLLVKAFEVIGDAHYLERAQQIGEQVIWPRGLLRKGVGLCHGISGNAYCFLALARSHNTSSTDNKKGLVDDEWRKRACYFAAFAMEHWADLEHVPDQPYSVYVGAGGLALLLMDLGVLAASSDGANTRSADRRDACRFPLYDL